MDNLSAPSALYRQNPETNAINCLLADFNEGNSSAVVTQGHATIIMRD